MVPGPQAVFSSSVMHVDFSSCLFPLSQARPEQIELQGVFSFYLSFITVQGHTPWIYVLIRFELHFGGYFGTVMWSSDC